MLYRFLSLEFPISGDKDVSVGVEVAFQEHGRFISCFLGKEEGWSIVVAAVLLKNMLFHTHSCDFSAK